MGFKKLASQLRKTIRLGAAILIWLNALAIFRPSIPLQSYLDFTARHVGIEPLSLSVLALITALSIASAYGFKNFALDFLYVWLFPFISVWYSAKALFALFKLLHRGVRVVAPTPDATMNISETIPLFLSIKPIHTDGIPAQGTGATSAPGEGGGGKCSRTKKTRFWILERVLGRSTLLWGLLVYVSSSHTLISVGLAGVLFGLIRDNLRLWFGASSIKRINDEIHKNASEWLSRIAEATRRQNQINPASPLNRAGSFFLLKGLVNAVAKTREASEVLILITLIAFGLLYVWLSLAFYFLYVGIAKLTMLPSDWPKWSDSLLFPIMGANLARSPILTVFVVCQYFEILALAYVLWTFVGAELRRLRNTVIDYEVLIDKHILSFQHESASATAVEERSTFLADESASKVELQAQLPKEEDDDSFIKTSAHKIASRRDGAGPPYGRKVEL